MKKLIMISLLLCTGCSSTYYSTFRMTQYSVNDKTSVPECKNYDYCDSLLGIKWNLTNNQISFTLNNLSDSILTIPWDEMIFIDFNNESKRIIHTGINEAGLPQPPSPVSPKSFFKDVVIPANTVQWDSTSAFDVGLKQKPVFTICKTESKDYAASEQCAVYYLYRYFSIVFPVNVQNTRITYMFKFKINGYNLFKYNKYKGALKLIKQYRR